jgi:hypothetical protein
MSHTFVELPENRDTREWEKFDLDDAGRVIVRTSAVGSFTPTGLKLGGRVTEVAMSASSWIALPPTQLEHRRQINIQNLSELDIKINYDPLIVGYVGVTIPAGGERQYLLEQNVIIYAKSISGNPTISIEELA